jgi:serine/threonine protein kinase
MTFTLRRSPIPPGEKLAGKYRIEREIGAGAMGVVVEAWHVELEQRVAIKFLHAEIAANEEGAERFRREARAAVRIESEHVAKVVDIGVLEQGIPYYVMEYLPGHDLSRELDEHGPLAASVAVDYVLQACEALAEAHGKGIIHRDLKPANLFLTHRLNGERTIKVLDFGISKITSAGSRHFALTDTTTLMGSPAYMSPEQLESSRNVDVRADIWSLGVILHELILGELPFRGDSVPQLVRAILAADRIPLTSRADVPSALEDIVARCLRQDRDERFPTIQKLQEALLPHSSSHGPSAGVATTPGVAPDLDCRVSTGGSAPGRASSLSPSLVPRDAAREHASDDPNVGTGPTSWGHTQRGGGWRKAVTRRGLGALLAVAAIIAGYLTLREWVPRAEPASAASRAFDAEVKSAASETPLASTPANDVVPAPAAPPEADPAAPAGSPGSSMPELAAPSSAKRPPAPGASSTSSAARASTQPRTEASELPKPAPSAAGANAPRRAGTGDTAGPRRESPEAVVPPAPATRAAADPAAVEGQEPPVEVKPPKSPSTRALDIPDFGGRK